MSKVRATLQRNLLRRTPTTPASSKWTSVGPCLDFYFVGLLVCGALMNLVLVGFSDMGNKPEHNGQEVTLRDGTLDWHVACGIRAKLFKDTVSGPEHLGTTLSEVVFTLFLGRPETREGCGLSVRSCGCDSLAH